MDFSIDFDMSEWIFIHCYLTSIGVIPGEYQGGGSYVISAIRGSLIKSFSYENWQGKKAASSSNPFHTSSDKVYRGVKVIPKSLILDG